MDDMQPHPLTSAEWKEVTEVPEVRESWGLEDTINPAEFAAQVYGVRFNFVSGSPGYVGDLFFLQGDALTGDQPLMLRRDDKGHLTMV
jgi:hypothetical protein